MRLFLVRHGETVDNVAGNYAGVTDSALTNHGVLQAKRLGQHLVDAGVRITHIFSSDLQRAFKTAEAVRLLQSKRLDKSAPIARETRKVALLREQNFGSYEGKRFVKRAWNGSGKEARSEAQKNSPSFKDVESKEAMRARADRFVEKYMVGLLSKVGDECSVVIVSHGIILNYLWRCILSRFKVRNVYIASGLEFADRGPTLEFLGKWSNTGYLELELRQRVTGSQVDITPAAEATVIQTARIPSFLDMSLVVKAVNSLEHLKGLRKTTGGIGSSKHDEGQKTIESFLKEKEVG